ncbi:hypothetical protein TNCV_678931 [Trichonephila clavipes]|nr:hypothetical protein TNCV_678931 [Trichonephila clavipes]
MAIVMEEHDQTNQRQSFMCFYLLLSHSSAYSLTYSTLNICEILRWPAYYPPGWRGWFVAGLLHSRLQVRPRPKSEDFPDAEKRQQPYRMIMRHEKDP